MAATCVHILLVTFVTQPNTVASPFLVAAIEVRYVTKQITWAGATVSEPGHRKVCHTCEHAPPPSSLLSLHSTGSWEKHISRAAECSCVIIPTLSVVNSGLKQTFFVLTCPKQSRGRTLRDRMLPLPSKTKQTTPGGAQQPPPKSTDPFREKVHPPRWSNVTTFPTFWPRNTGVSCWTVTINNV